MAQERKGGYLGWTAVRFAAFAVVAAVMFVIGISSEIYEVASPPSLTYHVLLRKVESVVAFAVVALALAWSLRRRQRRLGVILVVALAAYSALIEVVQRLMGSHETNWESLLDVACGALGGYIATVVIAIAARRRFVSSRRRE
jgi:hypothetical protein